MKKRIAVLACTFSMLNGSLCWSQDIGADVRAIRNAVAVKTHDGPIRQASLSRLAIEARRGSRSDAPVPDGAGAEGSWVERHPVLTGAIAGFGIGFGLTYAVAHDDHDEFLKPVGTGAAALFWGGVSAGIGALAGWGVARNH